MKKADIIAKIRSIYQQRKKYDGDTLQVLAEEIGISITRLHDSISGKFTSGKTLRMFREYLKNHYPVAASSSKQKSNQEDSL